MQGPIDWYSTTLEAVEEHITQVLDAIEIVLHNTKTRVHDGGANLWRVCMHSCYLPCPSPALADRVGRSPRLVVDCRTPSSNGEERHDRAHARAQGTH